MIRPMESHREAQREEWMLVLDRLYDVIESVTEAALDQNFLKNHKIVVEELTLTGGPTSTASNISTFFQPASDDELDKYPYAEDAWTQDRLRLHNRVLENVSNSGAIGTADALCVDLAWRATFARRESMVKTDADIKRELELPLCELRGWKSMEGFNCGMLHEAFYDPIFLSGKPRFYPAFSWESKDQETPHLMFALKHGTFIDEDLLRGEVMTILAVLQSRMPWPVFKKHIIFPVMVFSFVGGHGRIIQAHFDGEAVLIRKSKIFEFFDQKTAFANMNLFTRYLASNPVGDTLYKEALPATMSRTPPSLRALRRHIPYRRHIKDVFPAADDGGDNIPSGANVATSSDNTSPPPMSPDPREHS